MKPLSVLSIHSVDHSDIDLSQSYFYRCTQMQVYGSADESNHIDECLIPHEFDWTPEHLVTNKQLLNLSSQLLYASPNPSIILESCQGEQLSYEYRHATQLHGTFIYRLSVTLRASRGNKINHSINQLMSFVKDRLKKLKCPQAQNLV